MGLLDGGIADIVNNATSGLLLTVTVSRNVAGTSSPPAPWEPVVASTQTVTFKGFTASYKAHMIDGERIRASDRIVVVTSKSSSVANFEPKAGDRVSAGSVVGTVENCERDPAGATFTMQVRS